MSRTLPAALETLIDIVEARKPLGEDAPEGAWVRSALDGGAAMYANTNERLNISFTVDRLAFPEIQAMDPRVLRIPAGRNNELHRHAHESLFVVLAGEGEVRVGDRWSPVRTGDVAFVPRWIFHQTRNTSADTELVILAITDFGLTSAVLGDYDTRTRLSGAGADAKPG
jgi:mannose-6-phosphate isomerase-like protein (cupin superfamily)